MANEPRTQSRETADAPLISFDLREILTTDELEHFKAEAQKAGAPNLTEHFLNLTMRTPHRIAA